MAYSLKATENYSKEKARDAIFYSYKRHIYGFAAVLEEHEAAKIADHPDVVSVFLNQGRKLHTTHSWDFLMLEKNGVIHSNSIWKKVRLGEDTIIGNLDIGNLSDYTDSVIRVELLDVDRFLHLS